MASAIYKMLVLPLEAELKVKVKTVMEQGGLKKLQGQLTGSAVWWQLERQAN